ncbi:P-II family nitrogen regulator [bacterium]|jgi:nitrogen regulatory protein PII|nr:P-II family nitrogen regulator [bacterium]
MKQLTVVVRPFCAESVLETLQNLGLNSVIVREAKGYSRQKGYLDRYQGSEYSMAFIPKVEITVTVDDERVDEVAEKISKAARTGRIGDGKIFQIQLSQEEPLEF